MPGSVGSRWQKSLEDACREANIPAPVSQIVSERRDQALALQFPSQWRYVARVAEYFVVKSELRINLNYRHEAVLLKRQHERLLLKAFETFLINSTFSISSCFSTALTVSAMSHTIA
ncbi:hypothetical protein LX32DRAFT_192222 [Colletotrichum zoysiae]|uniref:Uncharacterized protein n=1 Tax=Colletotrichum zoysiae TaxID=1216348 RepID=A0AAD9H6Y8_9PEZI|nr:hypothetical protein LX32DRAFT_192222 [Colletotrichum zoysiae]